MTGIQYLLDELNEEQRIAATTDHKSVLVLAGAGSGKTKTIVARAAYLIWKGVPAQQIQIVTFTRRASSEIVSRVHSVLGDQANGIGASTFHSFCMKVLHRYRRYFNLNGMTVIDRDDQTSLFKLVIAQVSEQLKWSNEYNQLFKPTKILDLYSYARNTQTRLKEALLKQSPELLDMKITVEQSSEDKTAPESIELQIAEVIKRIMQEYEKMKQENGYLDYDDILEYVAQYVTHSSDFANKLAEEYPYLLIDEMQDTNPLQWLLVQGFVNKSHLFCVGDDAQSIYGFRGADFKNVHSFKDRVPNVLVLQLNKNYRSTQEILDISNWLLEQSALNYNKKLLAHRGRGIKPTLREFGNEYDEAKFIVDDILRRNQNGAKYSEHMILVRTAYSARAIEMNLSSAKIPYQFIGGRKFLEAAHIKDVLSALRVAINHKDRLAWVRLLTLFKGIGLVSANRMIEEIINETEFTLAIDKLKSFSKLPKDINIHRLINELAVQSDNCRKCFGIALSVLEETLKEQYPENWEHRKRDFDLLEKLAEKQSVQTFLETYMLDPISITEADKNNVEDVITLITVHSAKGTESEVCYLPNINPGEYPHSRATNFDEIEEERRVLYVAMTRAKNELILSKYKTSFFRKVISEVVDGKTIELPQYFLQGLPKEYLHISKEAYELNDEPVWNSSLPKPNIKVGMIFDDLDS